MISFSINEFQFVLRELLRAFSISPILEYLSKSREV